MRRLLTISTLLLGGLVTITASLLGAAFFWPALVINPTTIGAVAVLGAVKNVHAQWQDLHVRAVSADVWKKTVELSFAQLCIDAPFYKVSTCLPQVHLGVTVNLEPKHLGIVSIGPTVIDGMDLDVGPLPPSPPSASTIDWTKLQRPSWLSGTILHPVHVALRHTNIHLAGIHLEGGVQLDVSAPAPDPLAPAAAPSALVTLQLRGVCLREGPVDLDGCLDAGSAAVRIGLRQEVFALTQLGPVDLKAQTLVFKGFKSKPSDAPQAAAEASPPPESWRMPELLRNVRMQPVSVAIGSWRVHQAAINANGQLDFKVLPDGDGYVAKVDLGNACGDSASLGVKACFKTLRAAMTASQDAAGQLRLTTVGPVAATGGELQYREPAASPKPKQRPTTGQPAAAHQPEPLDPTGSMIPGWLRQAHLAPVRFELVDADIVQATKRFHGALTIDGRGRGEGALWDVVLGIRASGDVPVRGVNGRVTLSSLKGHFSGPWEMQSQADVQLAPTGEAHLRASTRDLGRKALGFDVRGTVVRGSEHASGDIKGRLDEHGVTASVNAALAGLIPHVQTVALNRCGIGLAWHHIWPDNGRLHLDCHVHVVPEALAWQKTLSLDWPPSADVQLAAVATTALPPAATNPLQGHLQVNLQPIATAEFSAKGDLGVAFAGSLSDLPTSMQANVTSHSRLVVANFERLVKAIGDSKYAVPAPLNVLQGEIVATVDASGEVLNSGLQVPMALTTRLKSGAPGDKDEQRLNTDVSAVLSLAPFSPDTPPQVKVVATLSDVQLALPRITLADTKAPQILPDRRMRRPPPTVDPEAAPTSGVKAFVGPPGPNDRPALIYEVQVLTPADHPLHLLSNMAKTPIPIRLVFTSGTTEPAHGTVGVHEFPLNLFKRKAFVDKMEVTLTSPEASPRVDGLLRVEYTDYTITITVLGTVKTPEIKLSSNPPRPENQLIAVLLFGREMSELDDDQLKSVDSFGGAAADGALSLASMYLLASTPVQSVGYDAQSKAFTAKVAIGKGTSLNIGSDMGDYQKLGVRRRIAREWAVETYVERNSSTEEEAVTALLEWGRRF